MLMMEFGMAYDTIIVNKTEELLYHLKILNHVMKEEEDVQQVRIHMYVYVLFVIAADMVNILLNFPFR